MAHAIETTAWTGEKPWHGLGVEVDPDLKAHEMMKAAGLGWKVNKLQTFLKDGSEVPDNFALVRDSDNKVLSTCGGMYKPVQNAEAFDFFKRFVDAGHMTMETAGSLHDGKFIWGLAKIGEGFTLGKADRVEGYILMCQPHKAGHALVIQFTPIRVVCWNTLTMALGSKLRGQGSQTFRMPHVRQFDDSAKKLAEETLGISQGQIREFKLAAELLSKRSLKDGQELEYFQKVFKPSETRPPVDAEKITKPVELCLDAMETGPGSKLKSSKGTLWGAFNAVTFVVDHRLGNVRSAALQEAWFGRRAEIKRSALEVAIQMAGVN